MKFSIIVLFVLGVIAAACAAVLMGIFNLGTSTTVSASAPIEVAMSNVALPAMTPVTSEHISIEKVTRDELPKGELVNATSVIGRVLAMPVYEGQILTEQCFVPEDSASQLLAMIPDGMRMVTVPVSSKSMPDKAFLRPGCIVDVVAVYKLSGQDSVSNTMLRGILVLAVDGETIISINNEVKEESKTTTSRSSRDSSVTLLVDTRQAEGLLLAVENGNISLSIRNPLDKNNEFEYKGTKLDRNRLGELGEDLEPTLPSGNESNMLIEKPNQPEQGAGSNNQQQGDENAVPNTVMPQQQRNQTVNQRKKVTWPIQQMRGQKTDVKEFEATETESGKIAPKK